MANSIIQITNISPSANSEQLRTLFSNIGRIIEFALYPTEEVEDVSKVCFIRFEDKANAQVALHLCNTAFLDRALIVLPYIPLSVQNDSASDFDYSAAAAGAVKFPDEKYANLIRSPSHTVAGIMPRSSNWPMNVINMVVGRPGSQFVQTLDPNFLLEGIPTYPNLVANSEASKIEEIRRTILVTNLDSNTKGEELSWQKKSCVIPPNYNTMMCKDDEALLMVEACI